MTLQTSSDWLDAIGAQVAAFSSPDAASTSEETSTLHDQHEEVTESLQHLISPTYEVDSALQTYNRDEVVHLAKHDLDFLALLVLGDIALYNYPPIFKAVWQLLTSATPVEAMRMFPKLALGLPRGFGKTTLIKLFMLWVLLFAPDIRFLLIVAATADKAEAIMADVIDMLETENIKKLFGDWSLGVEKDTQKLKKFGFRGRNIIFAAIGAEGSLRGMNLKHRRPELIVMDDVQEEADAESPELSDKLLRWIIGTLMKTKPYTGCVYVFIGNMYRGSGSILKKLKSNSSWTSFICGALLADGESIWPELVSKEQLLQELLNDTEMGHPEIFFAEVLNDPEAGSRSGIDVSKIPACPPHIANLEIPHQGACVIIDPASGKLNGNDVAIAGITLYDGIPYLQELQADKFSPGKCIEVALEMAIRLGTRLIVVESIGYQYTLLYWFDFICKSLHLEGFEIVALPTQEGSKNHGIKLGLNGLLKGELILFPEHRARVVHQIIYWNPIKRDNEDDILDVIRMVPSVLTNFGDQMIIESPFERVQLDQTRTLTMQEMFESTHIQYPQLAYGLR